MVSLPSNEILGRITDCFVGMAMMDNGLPSLFVSGHPLKISGSSYRQRQRRHGL
jgi:hypothetical protein